MDELQRAVARFEGRRVLVVGDVITDIYLEGKITRISREAPVLILEHASETIVLGGASNAAANLQSLRGQAVLVGLVGDDAPGQATRELAAGRGIDVTGVYTETGRGTCTKTRILASAEHTVKQQMLRVDRISRGCPEPEVMANLRANLARLIPLVDAVILSDYGLDILPTEIYLHALSRANETRRPVIVDSRHRMRAFRGATLLTPNVTEAEETVGASIRTEEDLVRAGWILMRQLEPEGLLITRGPEGMTLFERSGRLTHIPAANRQEVFDVSGAGDTVVAAVALGLAAGLDLQAAARLSNYAAGVVVRKMGTATVSPEELRAAIASRLCG